MTLKTALAAMAAAAFALPALAEGIAIVDPYARVSAMMSDSGAAFMVIENHGAEDDRLASATSPAAKKVELHTHKEDANGVMQMLEVPEGFVIPAGGSHVLKRGADHVMFLGLTAPLADGDSVHVTLTFDKAGVVEVEIPVDLKRKDGAMMGEGMGAPMGAGEGMGQMNGQMQGHNHTTAPSN